jgi:ABC-type transport system substrate-binding protein
VRRAIVLGTDWKAVTATWDFPGIAAPNYMTARFDLWGPEYACGFPFTEVDKAAANQLLDDAGWTLNAATGIREKAGIPMRLRITTYTGTGQEDNVVIWISELKSLGIDAVSASVEATALYSSFADNGPAAVGDFDLLYWDLGKVLGSPQTEAEQFYLAENIPSSDNPFGNNFSGVDNQQVRDLVAAASATTDTASRKESFCQVADIVSNEIVAEHWNGTIPNFQISSPQLRGWVDGEQFVYFGSDGENWYRQE